MAEDDYILGLLGDTLITFPNRHTLYLPPPENDFSSTEIIQWGGISIVMGRGEFLIGGDYSPWTQHTELKSTEYPTQLHSQVKEDLLLAQGQVI